MVVHMLVCGMRTIVAVGGGDNSGYQGGGENVMVITSMANFLWHKVVLSHKCPVA